MYSKNFSGQGNQKGQRNTSAECIFLRPNTVLQQENWQEHLTAINRQVILYLPVVVTNLRFSRLNTS